MSHAKTRRTPGFVLIEALIALVLIAIGLVAVSKLQTLSLFGSGDGRARADAANLSQQKLEELRNLLQKGDFTLLAGGVETVEPDPDKAPERVNTYTLTWAVTPDPDAKLEQHLVQLTTTWTDSRGEAQRLDMNTRVAWDDPGGQARLAVNTSKALISPTGAAQRGSGKVPAGAKFVSENHDKTKLYTDGDKTGKTYLTKPDGTIILYLPPLKNGSAQSFVRISGRVVFDDAGLKLLKSVTSDKVFVRLSSEGECIYDNTKTAAHPNDAAYQYFDYTCYVGPGWYGNVGVSTIGAVVSDPAVCVGDPGFNSVLPKLPTATASPEAEWSATRTYRGFHPNAGGVVLSAGMESAGRYGTSLDKDGKDEADGPFDGLPTPSALAAFYVAAPPAAGTALDYLRQDFLATGKKDACSAAMSKAVFKYNAGKHVCISPNELATPGDCPAAWPGYDDAPGPVGDACKIVIEGTADDKPNSVTAAFTDAPATSIGVCYVGTITGVANYNCTIDVPAAKLGSQITLTKLDKKLVVIGAPVDVPLPDACPTAAITQPI